jgi:hypothetical protein
MSVTWDPENSVEEALASMRVHDASPERVERTREKCLAVLAARRRRQGSRAASVVGWRSWLEPAVALGLGALYLADALVRVLAVYR